MSLASTSTQAPLLKRIYGNDVAKPLYEKSRFFANVTKDTKFVGKLREIVTNIAPTAGGGPDFAEAVAAQSPTTEKTFEVRRKREYSIFTIDNELIEVGKAGTGAIVDALKSQTDGARQLFFENISRRAWSGGGGSYGVVDASSSGTSLVFTRRSDVIGGINKGSRLFFADDDGTATNPLGLRSNQAVIVDAINRYTGTLTLNATFASVGGQVGDFVFGPGAYANSMTGLPGWCPFTAPSPGESFFGLDRTADVTRLAGHRIPFNTDIITTLHDAGAEAHLNGISPKHFYVNPLQYRTIVDLLDNQVQISEGKGYVGYKTITLFLATGPCEIIPEAYVPFGFGWLGDTSDFIFATAGDAPKVLTEGVGKSGLMLLPSADAWQGRLGAYGNMHVKDKGDGPGGWMAVDLAA